MTDSSVGGERFEAAFFLPVPDDPYFEMEEGDTLLAERDGETWEMLITSKEHRATPPGHPYPSEGYLLRGLARVVDDGL